MAGVVVAGVGAVMVPALRLYFAEGRSAQGRKNRQWDSFKQRFRGV
jgi:hypothetical protein